MEEIVVEFLKLDKEGQLRFLKSKKSIGLDYETLLEFQRSTYSEARDIVTKIALEIPGKELGYETLREFQKFDDDSDVRDLALKLILDAPSSVEYDSEEDEYKENMLRMRSATSRSLWEASH